MEKISVVFIGGLSNGKIVYDYLRNNRYCDLLLIITYPENSFNSKKCLIEGENVFYSNSANDYELIVQKLNPTYIFVAGWSELLSEKMINASQKGTIGFHPSKLPYNRGRSVVAWQIEEGYKETALTMFYYSYFPDGGDIIAHEDFRIEENDYVSDVLFKIDIATYNLMNAYFPLLRQGIAPRSNQDLRIGNFRRLRKDRDSLIDWNSNTDVIYNKIRAISRPYPGAIAFIDNEKKRIWKAYKLLSFPFGINSKPGDLIARLFDNSLVVKTKDSFINIVEYEEYK